jgi:UDP-3-O-[3-hydroxymyristoyl] glucosamine N-acyltransferase
MISLKTSQLAAIGGGRLHGPDLEISGLAGLKEAQPGQLSFLANVKYAGMLSTTQASCIIVSEEFFQEHSRELEVSGKSFLVSANPYLTWAKILTHFFEAAVPKPRPGVHPSAVVEASAKIDPTASVGALSVIEAGAEVGPGTVIMPMVYLGPRSKIGKDCLIYPQVSIREECVLGDRVILHCGAVVGSDGFGYAKDGSKQYKIPQIGNVIIEDEVEIGANVTVDRGAVGPTRIGRGTKIDNLVQIAHNVNIGQDCVIVAQSGVAGSSKLGDRVILAAQAGVVGHIEIGEDSIIGAQSGVPKSLPSKSIVFGYPARHHMKAKRIEAVVDRLPEYAKRIQELEKKVAKLEGRLEEAKPRIDTDER